MATAFAGAALLVLLVRAPLLAAETDVYTLEQLIDCAWRRHTDVAEDEWRLAESRAQLRQARAAYLLPRLRLESESGLVPDAEGDIFNPPTDTTGMRALGPFTRLQLEFAQPLFTFGQLSHNRRAAAAAVEAERARLAGTRLELARQVKRRYWAVLLAQELQALIERVQGIIDDRLAAVDEERVLSLADLYKLRLALLELDAQRDEVARKLELARAALAWQAGLSGADTLRLAADHLEPVDVTVPPLPELVERALASRPDWRQLQAGLAARQEQREAARSAYLPQIYLAGGLRYAVAPGRTDQHNPFIVDNFNYLNGGVFLGLRQSFEWGLLGAELDKARARYEGLRAKESGAAAAIALDVQRACTDYHSARAQLESRERARQLGRQWLQEAEDEYDFDHSTLDDLVDAFKTYAGLEREYQQAVHDHNVAVADLERTVGALMLKAEP